MNTNWKSYREAVAHKLEEWHNEIGQEASQESASDAYKMLCAAVLSSADATIGRCSQVLLHRKSQKLNKVIKQRNMAGWQWKRAVREQQRDCEKKLKRYRHWLAKVQEVKKQEQQEARKKWQAKVMKQGGLSSKMLWKSLKTQKQRLSAVRTPDGTVVSSPHSIVMATYDHFEQFGRTDDSGDRLENQPCPDGQEQLDRCPQLMSEVTEEEIQEAIRCLEKEKSAGEDDIPNEFIIEGGQAYGSSPYDNV